MGEGLYYISLLWIDFIISAYSEGVRILWRGVRLRCLIFIRGYTSRGIIGSGLGHNLIN